MVRDSLGQALTLQDPASLGPVNDFVEGFIACEARAVQVLQLAATDHSCIVQTCCAALHMFAENASAASNARPFIARALAASPGATAREQCFCAAVTAWVEGDVTRAITLHQQLAQTDPRDLVSVKLGQYHQFNRGQASAMLRLALAARDACADVPYLHGMLAFGFEQCHLLEQAEAAARAGMALRHKEPWAHHALAHVMLGMGRIHEGMDFMHAVSPSWTGLNSFMLTHNWWHVALFALELEQLDVALQLYDQQVWSVDRSYSQDQVNAVSLLARLELAGADVGQRWQELAPWLLPRLREHVLPFLDLQYAYGLARAGRPEAQQLLERMARHCTGADDAHGAVTASAWREVALPACRGLLAHAASAYRQAAATLGPVLWRLAEIGGSHAQRDLFEQIQIDSLLRSDQHSAAQQLLLPRTRSQPQSLRLQRQARRVHAALGLPAPG